MLGSRPMLGPSKDHISLRSTYGDFSSQGRLRSKWSRRGDSNSRPAVYETAALPLSYVGGDGEFTNAPPGHLPAAGRLGRSVDELGGGVHHFGLNVPRTRSVRTGGHVRDRFAADAQPIRAGIHQDGVALREVALQD